MQQQTIEQLALSTQKGGSAFAIVSGSLTFLNDNAAAIGAICALFGLLVATAGFLVNWHYQKKRTDLMRPK